MKSLFFRISTLILLTACSAEDVTQEKILIVVSNAEFYGDSELETSNHFAEIILAYDEFVIAGFEVDFLSPEGGEVSVGYIDDSSIIENQYLNDSSFMAELSSTLSPTEVRSSDYRAIYYAGGGAAMFGVPESKEIQDIAMSIYEENHGVVSAVCHGSAGLAYLKTKDGVYLVQGKRVSGFPDLFEDIEGAYYATFPFSIEKKLSEHGAEFIFSEEGWDDYFTFDQRLVTGQDPTAVRSVAKQVVEQLKAQ